MTDANQARIMLDLAARLGWMAAGRVEPNPLVGCVVERDGRIIGMGHHRVFGGLHAEAAALEDCRRRGNDPAGATVHVTLEPCNHTGKQPPCTEALIAAKVARVVMARRDPNPVAASGAERLRAAGIAVEFSGASVRAARLSDAFVKKVTTGLPWVIAKWAQTIDGKIATRTGESQWISNEQSRRQAHRTRGRVDAVITGIGTVLADDPELTARHVKPRRIARRVVIDPQRRLPPQSQLLRTASWGPVLQVTGTLRGQKPGVEPGPVPGVEVLRLPLNNELLDLREVLRHLGSVHGASNVLVESGPSLMGAMFTADLVDEVQIYVGPIFMGDEQALPPARGPEVEALADARRYELYDVRKIGGDARLSYRRPMPT